MNGTQPFARSFSLWVAQCTDVALQEKEDVVRKIGLDSCSLTYWIEWNLEAGLQLLYIHS